MSLNPKEKPRRTVGFGVFVGTSMILLVISIFGFYIYYTTSANYESLQREYLTKSQLLENLNSSYMTLISQYAQLNNNYVSLQKDYTDLLQIAKLQKTETKFLNHVITLTKDGYEGIQFSSQYAGYVDVKILATSPISLLVTNYKYGIVLDYPTNGETFVFASFKMPVLDGTTFMQFFSTTSSVVTVNVTLYY